MAPTNAPTRRGDGGIQCGLLFPQMQMAISSGKAAVHRSDLETAVLRLSLPCIHQFDGLQPGRRHAAEP